MIQLSAIAEYNAINMILGMLTKGIPLMINKLIRYYNFIITFSGGDN